MAPTAVRGHNNNLILKYTGGWVKLPRLLCTEMADRLRVLEKQKRDEEAGRLTEIEELQRLEEERMKEEELKNERIYHEELRR